MVIFAPINGQFCFVPKACQDKKQKKTNLWALIFPNPSRPRMQKEELGCHGMAGELTGCQGRLLGVACLLLNKGKGLAP